MFLRSQVFNQICIKKLPNFVDNGDYAMFQIRGTTIHISDINQLGSYQETLVTPFAATTKHPYSIAIYTVGNLDSGYNYPCLLCVDWSVNVIPLKK